MGKKYFSNSMKGVHLGIKADAECGPPTGGVFFSPKQAIKEACIALNEGLKL